jgi:adenylate cyclase
MRTKALNEEAWREMLNGRGSFLVRTHRLFGSLPSDPRCKLCHAPYGGPVGSIMTMLGFGKYPANPQLCNSCFRSSAKNPGGAEIELSVLFADVRGSTGLAETMPAAEYSRLLNAYYRVATDAIREPGGLIDKLLGDGVMALFITGFTGANHAEKAVDAARKILREVQLPVGAGVHTGIAWVGFVGGGEDVVDFTALGDAVNTASRLGSEAETGELLLSEATVRAAGLATAGLSPRRVELRGRAEPLNIWSERVPVAVS